LVSGLLIDSWLLTLINPETNCQLDFAL